MTLVPSIERPGPPPQAPGPDQGPRGVPREVVVGVLAAVVAGAQLAVAVGAHVPLLSPLVGFAACAVVPAFLVHQLLGRWWWWEGGERLTVAVALVLLLLMAAGLVDNFVLPVVGISNPLSTWPTLVTGDVLDLGLGAAALRRMPRRVPLALLPASTWRARACVGAGAVSVPLAAMGAVRLNNGAGPALTLVTLALVMAALAALFRWRDLVESRVAPLTLYGLSLALLFMTSLRGWYTTGHDVQHEMLDFLHTSAAGRWSTSLHDGYNACLSITVLPTVFLRWTRVADPYVFKVFFQCLYAFVPVAVYYLGRRITSEAVALVSAVYFVGFVGFLQDMPMLNRQEVAFLFFVSALLVLFMAEHTRRWRWAMFCMLGVGMVVSHYSTSYFATAALVVAVVLRPVLGRLLARLAGGDRPSARSRRSALAWPLAAFLLAVTAVWNGPLNHSGGAVVSELTAAVHRALGHGGPRAAEAGYSLAGPGRGASQDQALASLLDAEAKIRDSHPRAFVPAPPPSTSLTPPAPIAKLPATTLGRALTGSGRGASLVNRVWRTAAAGGMQALLAAGLLVVTVRRRWSRRVEPDAVVLGLAVAALVALQVLLPMLSLDYGVGRSFMQALMVLGPFMALGTVALAVGPLRRWRLGLAFGVALAFFASTSGFVPQLLGGYGPQLHLNNAGDYYDRFYLHSSEVAAVQWLQSRVILPSSRYPDIQMDHDLFNRARSLGGVRAYDDIYPSDIRRDAYVVLGYPNVADGRFETTYDGYELWLHYPISVLDSTKSVIYSNSTTRIYR